MSCLLRKKLDISPFGIQTIIHTPCFLPFAAQSQPSIPFGGIIYHSMNFDSLERP